MTLWSAQVSGLQRRVMELETSEHQTRKMLQDREAHQQQCDQRHRETTAQLEIALEDAGIKVKELSVQVGLAESKVRALEEQLGLGDTKRRDLELKLAGLCSAVHRTVGTNHARLSGTLGSRRRSPSPWRNHLQMRGMVMHFHHKMMAFFTMTGYINKCVVWLGGDNDTDGSVLFLSRGEDDEPDVDSVHTVLREFQQELRDTQRDRVYFSFLISE